MKQITSYIIATIVCMALFSGLAFSQSGMKHYFQEGNQAYRNEDFQSALEWYQKIISAGFESSQVYYNMGNCYYKLGDIGKAILYYEKALKLNPKDREILFNLELANLRVIDRIDLPPKFFLFQWWDSLKSYFTLSEWTKLTITFYIISILVLTIFLFLRFHRLHRLILFFLTVFTALTVFSAYILVLKIQEKNNTTNAVVLTSSVNVVSAPDESSTDVFVLHEGVKVGLAEQRGDWVRISLPDGKSGWIRQENLGII